VDPLPLSLSALPGARTRESAFSYACGACGRCCHDKQIRVSPYELARLASSRGLSTSLLIERYTEGGTTLSVRGDGGCVFLSPRGCTVHADRPLVCRLYPLGRVAGSDGSERFVDHPPHPETEGRYGEDGTIAEFLEGQGVGPYLLASDRYYDVLLRMVDALQALPEEEAALAIEEAAESGSPAATSDRFLDVDSVVDAECRRRGTPRPADVEGRVELHLEVLRRWVSSVAGGERARDAAGD
jgi:uncharacterized protein